MQKQTCICVNSFCANLNLYSDYLKICRSIKVILEALLFNPHNPFVLIIDKINNCSH